jgi:cytochrome P450
MRTLFEVPIEMEAQIGEWSATLSKMNDIMLTQEQKRAAQDALDGFKEFLRGHTAARRHCPHRGMITDVIEARDQGIMSEEEMLISLVSMLIAGHETTVTLIGNGLLMLLQHPAELARLRADRGLMRTAVEECLRFWPGINLNIKVAREALVVEGVEIPRGSLVIGLVASINRDPARFERPDAVDIGRRPNPHVSFGSGIHLCIGAPLGRLETQIAFDLLLDRYPLLELAGDPEWLRDRINTRGLERLLVTVGP